MRFSGFNEMIAHWADVTPEAPALRYASQSGDCVMTYRELLDAVAAEAEALRRTAPDGRCVGFFLNEARPVTLIRMLAAVTAGRQVVLLDENTPVPVLRGALPYTDIDSLEGDPELCALLRDNLCPPKVTGGAGRLLFFTSGTTARSKAVVLTEQSLCASAYNGSALLPLSPADTLLCVLPLCHVFGFVCGLLWGLNCGACVALGRGARHYVDDCARFRPTAAALVPSLLGFLQRQNALNDELKLILVGAGDCPPGLLAAALSGGRRVSFGYGLTETSSGVALSLGEDPYAMTVCPDDRISIASDGEILISAPTCVMLGYYKCPEDTAKAVRQGVLYTGDLGVLDAEGRLRITGRKKEILVLGNGTKIFLPEYERRISAILGTTELAVVLHSGAPVLVLRRGDEDRDAVLERLAPLMEELPMGRQLKDVLFLDGPLPRTAAGKIRRWAVQQKVRRL